MVIIAGAEEEKTAFQIRSDHTAAFAHGTHDRHVAIGDGVVPNHRAASRRPNHPQPHHQKLLPRYLYSSRRHNGHPRTGQQWRQFYTVLFNEP